MQPSQTVDARPKASHLNLGSRLATALTGRLLPSFLLFLSTALVLIDSKNVTDDLSDHNPHSRNFRFQKTAVAGYHIPLGAFRMLK